MKVLIVNKFLYPNGGSETYILKLGQELKNMGHKVQYFGMWRKDNIVGNEAGSYTSNLDFSGNGFSKILYPFKIIYSVESRKKIRSVLKNFDPEIVHINNFNFQLTPSILYEIDKYRRKNHKKIKIIYTAHDSQLVCPNHLMQIPSTRQRCMECLHGNFGRCVKNKCIHNSTIKSIFAMLEGKLYYFLKTYRLFDVIICPSDFLKQRLSTYKVLRDKLIVLHNFVEDDFKIKDYIKDNYVLYCGRYSSEKGIDTLLKVCKMLPEVPFVFIGDGPLVKEIEKVENITNKGFMSGRSLVECYQKANFTVFPSECYENCPFTVMESITSGTPVIGSCIGGVPELINDKKNGELFESGNVEELAGHIQTLWENTAIQQKYSQLCLKNNFDNIGEYTKKIIDLYKK